MNLKNVYIFLAIALIFLGVGVIWVEILLLFSMFWNGFQPYFLLPIIAILIIYVTLWLILFRKIKK